MVKKLFARYRKIVSDQRVHLSLPFHLTLLECNRKIGMAIEERIPFFVGRIGWTEGTALGRWCDEGSIPEKIKETLHHVSGVFPLEDQELEKFSAAYISALSKADILGVMPAEYQGWLIKTYASQARRADLSSIEPYFCEEPWSWYLRERKVLVIHPFSESIVSQYTNVREKIFKNPKMLPPFSLITIKTPQTIHDHGTKESSWSETLERLKQQVRQQEFDVAIIGCGAYGFPLAAAIKEMGKIAIHLGGSTQLLFGIKGRRWENFPKHRSMMNSVWVAPLESERPLGWEKIEDGCYW